MRHFACRKWRQPFDMRREVVACSRRSRSHAQRARHSGASRPNRSRFGRRHEHAGRAACAPRRARRPAALPFPPIDGRRRPATCRFAYSRPLGGIDVDEVEHNAQPRGPDVLRHRRREDDGLADSLLRNVAPHPRMQAAVAVVRQRQGFPGQKTGDAAQPRGPWIERLDMSDAHSASSCGTCARSSAHVDESAEVDARTARPDGAAGCTSGSCRPCWADRASDAPGRAAVPCSVSPGCARSGPDGIGHRPRQSAPQSR